jgi:hypothetical protein
MVGTSMLSRLTGTVMIKGPNSRKPLECSNAITPTASKTTGGNVLQGSSSSYYMQGQLFLVTMRESSN